MKVIQPNCRIQFTGEDISFILKSLGRDERDREMLTKLLTDEESRDLILDDDAIFRSLLETTHCLPVSTHFYFYILVRNVLKKSGIQEREVADYVAEVLAEFSQAEQVECRLPGRKESIDYFFEMIAALQKADELTSFYLRQHIGNQSLFLSGIFPQRIRYRAEFKGFPDLSYYEELGRMNFRVASDHRLASRYDLSRIFTTLAEHFHAARLALNDLTDRLFTMDNHHEMDRLLKRGVIGI
ncbi:MAG: hypothetical protein SFY81_16860 [Verrucomicrobiota bacterium]|nr:hypothetical protein [Verrucomicrobiota bacterium]